MDSVIFYKKGGLDQNKVNSVRLSYQREYNTFFPLDEKGLISRINDNPNALCFYFTDNLTNSDRIMIRNIKSSYQKSRLVLCSHSSFALDAWKMRVFDFLDQPIDNLKLIGSYKEYILEDKEEKNEFVLKTKDGIRRIPFRYINYFKASGNYSSINLIKDKSILQTKQLHRYDYITEESNSFRRVHRSIILNLKNIKQVGNKLIAFYQTEKPLEISKALEIKIKQILLGK